MRYVTYNRVSTDAQTEGTSLDWQRDQQRAWGERAGWTHVEDIFDGGQSGAKLDRTGVQRTLELLRDHSVDLVSFYKVDRAARAQRVFEDLWTAIYTLGGKVFIHQKAKVYEILDDLMADTVWDRAMAEQERYSIHARTADGYEQHLVNGSFIFTPIFGYFTVKERRNGYGINVLRVDNDKARLVRMVMQETIAGESYEGVAAKLNGVGAVTARRREWTGSSVQNVLSRRAQYVGLPFTHQRTVRGKRHEVQYTYPPIISGQEYRLLERAIRLKPRGSGPAAPLRGAVRCAACGSMGVSVAVRKCSGLAGYALYCASYRRSLEYRREGREVPFTPCPHAVSVRVVGRALSAWLDGGGFLRGRRLLEARVMAYEAGTEAASREVERAEGELESLERRLLRIDGEELSQVARVINTQITALLGRLEGLRKQARSWRSRHHRGGVALSRLPSGVEGLRAAILAEDRVAMNEAVADLSIQIGVNFGEPDRAARHASILPRIDVLVADEVEAHPTYVVQLP